MLGIPFVKVFEFQLTAVIVLDQIWFAHNQLIHKNITPVVSNTLKSNSNIIRMHLQAWKASSFGQSIWHPPPIGLYKD